MSTYLIMGRFTPQGNKTLKQTTTRSEKFREIAKQFGVKVKDIFWLMGDFDVVNIVEADEEKSVSALLFELGTWGNVSTTTLRAYTKEEMDEIFKKMDIVLGRE